MNQFTDILFDFDNTLVDFKANSHESFRYVYEQLDLDFDESDYELYSGINAAAWRKLEKGILDLKTLKIQRFELFLIQAGYHHIDPKTFQCLYIEGLIKKVKPYNGVTELLSKLKKTYRLHIITNGLKEAQRPRLTQLGWLPFFENIFVSEEIGSSKPSIEYFNTVLSSLKQKDKSKLLVVGDNFKADILGAKNAELPTCWISMGRRCPKPSQSSDFTFENVIELEDLLLK